jgi:hypothetical protein
MGFEQQTPRKRLRAFSKAKKTKHRSLNFSTQHTVTRGDNGPKENRSQSSPIAIYGPVSMKGR